jgi:hypothetical protein
MSALAKKQHEPHLLVWGQFSRHTEEFQSFYFHEVSEMRGSPITVQW